MTLIPTVCFATFNNIRNVLAHNTHLTEQLMLLQCKSYSVKTQLQDTSYNSNSPLEVFQHKIAEGQLEADKTQHGVVEALQKVYENIEDYTPRDQNIFSKWFSLRHNTPKGLYIHGAVGGGKTMLMDLFYNCCDTEHKQRVHFNSFMVDVHKRIHVTKNLTCSQQSNDAIGIVAETISENAWLICFDEFQVTDIADAMILKHLFTHLFEKGVVVVATSNRAPDDLYKNGLQRSNFIPFIQVLKNHCDVANLDSGIDYRAVNVSCNADGYFFLNESQQVDKLFKLLCLQETDIVRPKILTIQGRNVKFERTCGQIVDTTFDELCDRPLGANDYLHISQVFHTIILRNIPQLNFKMESQARRFITLIDTLYDRKARLVVDSILEIDAIFHRPKGEEPQGIREEHRMLMDDLKINVSTEGAKANIFTGDEEVFAFARTISRLKEMQTVQYWENCNK